MSQEISCAILRSRCVVLVGIKNVAYFFLKIIECIAGNWMGQKRSALAPRSCLILQQMVNLKLL